MNAIKKNWKSFEYWEKDLENIYDKVGRAHALEEDEIADWEEGFMRGWSES